MSPPYPLAHTATAMRRRWPRQLLMPQRREQQLQPVSPVNLQGLPEAQHAGNGHERSEKEDGTYRYLIWTFLSVAFVAAGLYALITYTNRIAAVAGGKPRQLPPATREADEEMMDVSVLLASPSSLEQCACSVENEKATKVQPIEVGKPRKAERKQVKAPAPKSKTTKPKGSKSVTSSVHVPPAPCEVDETYFETPAARALPPLPTELSPKSPLFRPGCLRRRATC